MLVEGDWQVVQDKVVLKRTILLCCDQDLDINQRGHSRAQVVSGDVTKGKGSTTVLSIK